MSIEANIKVYLLSICGASLVMLLLVPELSVSWTWCGFVVVVIIPALVLGALRPPSIIGASIDDGFAEFKVLSWNGVRTSKKYPVQEIKCIRELHSLTKSGSRDFCYRFYINGERIGTLYAFTLFWDEAPLERFIGMFGPDIFKK
jgi:hypothetical protein